MATQKSRFVVNLFYSYSHRDSQHRASMEDSLALLKGDGLLVDWSDQAILPGKSISTEVRDKIDNADIIVFLLSPNFIASSECMKEWRRAEKLATENPHLFRVPIIVRPCAWMDLLKHDDLKALPLDGKPVVKFTHADDAWQQVYEGIKAIVDELRNASVVKEEFREQMEETDFLSQDKIRLTDIFVFLPLLCRKVTKDHEDNDTYKIAEPKELLSREYTLIHGADRSGKTALGRYLFLTLVEQSAPVLYVDLNQVPQNIGRTFLQSVHQSQFHGDYTIWNQRQDKTLILDNLSSRSGLIEFVVEAKKNFDRIIVTLSSNIFYSFFRDESRLADFEELEITELTHVLQESLIKKRLSLTTNNPSMTDAQIDRIEDRVNSIIIDNRIVPRYPFFVLCILQTYEAYMPSDMDITSYGHCYYTLIVASLRRAGISRQDADINACFNFAEQLAFETYEHMMRQGDVTFEFDTFVKRYKEEYVIQQSIIKRLMHDDFGLIDDNGHFRTQYMLYFFLGRSLARSSTKSRSILRDMCDATHVPGNYLTLLFTIHHTSDQEIIDDILLKTMITLDDVSVARLDRIETRRFQDIVSELPSTILSSDSVEYERTKERDMRDNALRSRQSSEMNEESEEESTLQFQEKVNGVYRVLKNNEIMAQVLRTKYGNITKDRIEEIIEIMADGGLRLVNFVLKDEDEIIEMAQYVKAKNPDYDVERIKRELGWFSFVWTMTNLERIVKSFNIPEIRPSIQNVAQRSGTPAYDLISYFSLLDAAQQLTEQERSELARLMKKHRDPFVKGVISLRTQHYINTHRSQVMVEQSVCSLLGIKYRTRPSQMLS